VKIGWNDVWIGAAVTALLFTIGKFVIGMYIGKTSIGSGYGAAGSIVVLITWIYYSAQILYFGAEFTQVYATSHGTHVIPKRNAEKMKPKDEPPSASGSASPKTVITFDKGREKRGGPSRRYRRSLLRYGFIGLAIATSLLKCRTSRRGL
jgi:hypothetical protein